MRYFSFILFLSSFWLLSCKPSCKWSSVRQSDEVQGQELLNRSRAQLTAKKYDEAERTIEELRKNYPLALTAREEAIVLLDSIYLARSSSELMLIDVESKDGVDVDSLRRELEDVVMQKKFYMRKLEYDKTRIKRH